MLLPGLPLPYTHESTHILSTCKALNKVFLQKETMNIIYHWMCKGSHSLNLAEQSLPLKLHFNATSEFSPPKLVSGIAVIQ